MKKLLFGLFLTALTTSVQAQDNILQIVPTDIAKDAEWPTLSIEMLNTASIHTLQFNISLPDGISLYADYPYEEEFNTDRFPHTTVTKPGPGGGTTSTYEHIVNYQLHDDYTTFIVESQTLNPFYGNEGSILSLYITLADNIKDGFYPITISNIVFTDVDNQPIKSPEISTYVRVGSPSTTGAIDLSSLTGYMPADVVTATNTWLADKTDITSIDLSGLDDAAAKITPANKNALVYAKAESDFAKVQTGNNVVAGEVCDNLVLTDGYPFAASKAFTATAASYSRTVPAAGWYSLCLPFAATTPDGVTVERYVSKDVTNKTVRFNGGAIEADKPCIFKTPATDVTFNGSNVAVAVTGSELADGDFVGTYSKIEGTLENCYGLHPDGSGFGIATASASAAPFRAYINTSEVAGVALKVIHGDGETTGITAADAETNKGSKVYYNLAGQRVVQPVKGIYIVDGKKVVIK